MLGPSHRTPNFLILFFPPPVLFFFRDSYRPFFFCSLPRKLLQGAPSSYGICPAAFPPNSLRAGFSVSSCLLSPLRDLRETPERKAAVTLVEGSPPPTVVPQNIDTKNTFSLLLSIAWHYGINLEECWNEPRHLHAPSAPLISAS